MTETTVTVTTTNGDRRTIIADRWTVTDNDALAVYNGATTRVATFAPMQWESVIIAQARA